MKGRPRSAASSLQGSIEYGAYSWATCGWTSNSGLGSTVCPTAANNWDWKASQ